jgi:thioester reductase-like protein
VAIFLTGGTGYIGGYAAARLLEQPGERLNVLVRAQDREEAARRLWHTWQLHMDFPVFRERLARTELFVGDITEPQLGLDRSDYERLAATTDSVIHVAATLNRKSEKSCLNVNLRGTLAVIQLAARAHARHGLRRFSHVSTVAVAGARQNEIVEEDRAIDWERSDYDPYARTKKFAEHMLRELLPDVPRTIFRPSIVLGDSGRPETTQFDMVRAFVFLAGLPVLPFHPADRLDIVPVDYVADAIATLHRKERPEHEIYHLSAGADSESYRAVTGALAAAQHTRPPLFLPSLERPFAAAVNLFSERQGTIGYGASLLKVFLPYLVWNTVFDNARVVRELGRKPAPFSSYCYQLLRFSRENHFRYAYRDWPDGAGGLGR